MHERHLLACEIHDGFIQDLVGAKMLVESLRPRLGEEHSCLHGRLETIEGARQSHRRGTAHGVEPASDGH